MLFVLTVLTVGIGWRRGLIDACELALAAGLLFIPYFTRGYTFGMLSMGRFIAVVPALYLVFGHGLARLPAAVAAAALAFMGFFLAAYSAMFAAHLNIF